MESRLAAVIYAIEDEAADRVSMWMGFNAYHKARFQVANPVRTLMWARIGSEVEDQVKAYFTSGGR